MASSENGHERQRTNLNPIACRGSQTTEITIADQGSNLFNLLANCIEILDEIYIVNRLLHALKFQSFTVH